MHVHGAASEREAGCTQGMPLVPSNEAPYSGCPPPPCLARPLPQQSGDVIVSAALTSGADKLVRPDKA